MRLAAIDIGSNAIRLLIEEVISKGDDTIVRKISLTRVPLRLGEDTFLSGKISTKKINQLVRTMEAFWKLMDVHEVAEFRACATSALREAENGEQVVEIVRLRTNINIELIDGQEEAGLLFSNFRGSKKLSADQSYLYIDLGGGSTEITLIEGNKSIAAKSFKIGTVRGLRGIPEPFWAELDEWVKSQDLADKQVIGIGTGGNINRLHKEAGLKSYELLSYSDLENTYNYLNSFTFDERVIKLRLKPDRADVIIPAAEIYLRIMKLSGVKEVMVPKVGLSDGIILELFTNWKKRTAATSLA